MSSLGEDALGITYRAATPEDAGGISGLVLGLLEEFAFHEYTDEGVALMRRELAPGPLAETIAGDNVVFVADRDGRLVGVVSIRNNQHLSLNFVEAKFHRRGISHDLWEMGKAECIKRGNPGRFTLRASTYAVPVYESWGFVKTGEIDRTGGGLSHPMVLED